MLASRPLLSFVVSSQCLLAQASWSQLYPAQNPPQQFNQTYALHEGTGKLLMLFGGSWSQDTAWQFLGNTWSQVLTPTPSNREQPMTVHDAARQQVVMFGGFYGGAMGDTWLWNGTTWSNPTLALSPSARSSGAMAFDRVRNVAVLFGGRGAAGTLGDTWEWNGSVWLQKNPLTSPSPRSECKMAFDPVNGGVVLHGGYLPIGALVNDTWTFQGSNWQLRQPLTPPPVRIGHAMVADLHRRRVVLLGGNTDPFAWEWDGSQWQVTYQPTPAPRSAFGMAYDPITRRTLVHGGSVYYYPQTYFLNDTWVYRSPLPADVVPFGTGCTGSAGTPSLTNAPYVLPWLGDTLRNFVGNVPAASLGAIFVSSFGSTPPVSLGLLGMPGCTAYVPLDTAEFRSANGGQAEWSLLLPNTMALAGAQFRQQVYVLDAPANAFGLTASNAVTVTLGVR